MVLIKAVLHALPIYFMATSRISNTVLQKLNGIISRFFWGKVDCPRYLAYVAWDKMCRPKEEGGMGFKNLKAMNEVMITKLLWKLASRTDSQWAMLAKAKYLPKSSLWTSKHTYNCT